MKSLIEGLKCFFSGAGMAFLFGLVFVELIGKNDIAMMTTFVVAVILNYLLFTYKEKQQ